MTKTSKQETAQIERMEGFEGHYHDLGEYTVGFETYTKDANPAALFKGLPDDHCQCPHWGYVLRGKLTFRYEDGSKEEITSGEAHYATPGHLPLLTSGTEVVEFSPTEELKKTMEVLMKNMKTPSATQ